MGSFLTDQELDNINGIYIGAEFHHFDHEDMQVSYIKRDAADLLIKHIIMYGVDPLGLFKTIELCFRALHPDAPNELLDRTGKETNTVITVEAKEWLGVDRFDPYMPLFLTTVHRKRREELADPNILAKPVNRAYTFGTIWSISDEDWVKVIQEMKETGMEEQLREAVANDNELFHVGAFTVSASELLGYFTESLTREDRLEWDDGCIDDLAKQYKEEIN